MKPSVAAVFWIDTDGQFHVFGHDHEDAADDHAEFLSERGLPALSMTRAEFIEKASSE